MEIFSYILDRPKKGDWGLGHQLREPDDSSNPLSLMKMPAKSRTEELAALMQEITSSKQKKNKSVENVAVQIIYDDNNI